MLGIGWHKTKKLSVKRSWGSPLEVVCVRIETEHATKQLVTQSDCPISTVVWFAQCVNQDTAAVAVKMFRTTKCFPGMQQVSCPVRAAENEPWG
jgi:hypothetical protein